MENAEVSVADQRVRVVQPHGGVLANFPKGVSGNPRGRPAAGAVIEEWYNALAGRTEEEYQKIADDASEPGAKRTAARSWLRALSTEYFNATPLAANDLDRILDRTIGKPTQRIEVAKVERDPASIMSDLAGLLAAHPHIAAEFAAVIPVDAAPALPPAPPV